MKDLAVRAIAVIGLIAILVLGAWGIIQLAVGFPTFLGSIGSTVQSVFTRDTSAPVATTEETDITQPSETPAQTTTSKPATTKPASTYVASQKRATNLYGYPDLVVRIISVTPAGTATNVQFEVSNVGTNVASGWSFKADLPLPSPYNTYTTAGQALYPGDKVVYTMTVDRGGSYPYSQYQNYNYNYPYNYNTGTCYTYNGYANYPTPCPQNYNYWNTNYNNYNYYNQYPYAYAGGLFSLTIDCFNAVAELNEGNNYASTNI